jgi:hypothetical protein
MTVLYVNGDSHAAAAEAVVPAAFAEDQGYPELGRQPHPDNLAASWAKNLSQQLDMSLVIDAESAASNHRILRTTNAWLDQLPPWESALVIIGWSTWEREEWLVDGEYLQVGSSGLDWVPDSQRDRYRNFVVNVDWAACQQLWHKEIWQLHCRLQSMKIPHLFFNCNNKFDQIPKHDHRDWGPQYLEPYTEFTYDYILRTAGFQTVNPNSWHFGQEAHCFWADFMLQYCTQNHLI